ncbi:MAG: magnesium/cobalt transporter CorA [Bacteroidales bacterium]|nr:magnesium/cobalt transporter CorA [Bacteroidales bacterium]
MARFVKLNKESIGISPDAITFLGDKKVDTAKCSLFSYNSEELTESQEYNLNQLYNNETQSLVNWINIHGLHDIEMMSKLQQFFNIDPLIISNILNPNTRPKILEYSDSMLITLKMIRLDQKTYRIFSDNLSLVIHKNYLISIQEQKAGVFDAVRERLRQNKPRIRKNGPDYLAFALMDIVIDNYIYIISKIGEKIEALEDQLYKSPHSKINEEINFYKREINYLRKIVLPCKELIYNLLKLDTEKINDHIDVHWRELQDNINLAHETIENYNEILKDQLNMYQTYMSNKLNEIMKFLTIFSVIFIPLTFIAGIYGTNFDYLPELHYQYAYPLMWLVMVLLALGMLIYFKYKKWF